MLFAIKRNPSKSSCSGNCARALRLTAVWCQSANSLVSRARIPIDQQLGYRVTWRNFSFPSRWSRERGLWERDWSTLSRINTDSAHNDRKSVNRELSNLTLRESAFLLLAQRKAGSAVRMPPMLKVPTATVWLDVVVIVVYLFVYFGSAVTGSLLLMQSTLSEQIALWDGHLRDGQLVLVSTRRFSVILLYLNSL